MAARIIMQAAGAYIADNSTVGIDYTQPHSASLVVQTVNSKPETTYNLASDFEHLTWNKNDPIFTFFDSGFQIESFSSGNIPGETMGANGARNYELSHPETAVSYAATSSYLQGELAGSTSAVPELGGHLQLLIGLAFFWFLKRSRSSRHPTQPFAVQNKRLIKPFAGSHLKVA